MRCSCGIILRQCGYGGIGRRVWFGLRYDSVKINRSHDVGTVLCFILFYERGYPAN